MYGHNVSLKEIPDAREARLGRQQLLLKTYGRPIVSFTMNIAGERKRSPLAVGLLLYRTHKVWA